jgi:hypothetical protein
MDYQNNPLPTKQVDPDCTPIPVPPSAPIDTRFPEATADSRDLIAMALDLGRRIWRAGFRFAKASVVLSELVERGLCSDL